MTGIPEAQEVLLKKTKPLAPAFHRHIAKSKMIGKPCRSGDTVVIYKVISTEPAGEVIVTDRTVIRFDD